MDGHRARLDLLRDLARGGRVRSDPQQHRLAGRQGRESLHLHTRVGTLAADEADHRTVVQHEGGVARFGGGGLVGPYDGRGHERSTVRAETLGLLAEFVGDAAHAVPLTLTR